MLFQGNPPCLHFRGTTPIQTSRLFSLCRSRPVGYGKFLQIDIRKIVRRLAGTDPKGQSQHAGRLHTEAKIVVAIVDRGNRRNSVGCYWRLAIALLFKMSRALSIVFLVRL